VYVFILTGQVTIEDQLLETRDGFGIWGVDHISIKADSDAEFLLMDVPMGN
jgi:quercetin 2,3-dioxygenase